MIVQALTLTLRLAVCVSLILLVLGVPLAYWLAFSRKRWKFFIEAIVSLPIVLPPTVLGFYVLVAIGPLSPVGRWYQSFTGHGLAFTFSGLVVGSVLYSLPVRGAANGDRIRFGRPQAARRVCFARRFKLAHLLANRSAFGIARRAHRLRPQLCAHAGRVRRRLDDRRQYSWSDPHDFNPDLRPG